MLEASGDAGGMFLEKVPATYTSSTLYLTIATTCFSFLYNIKRIWRTMYQTTSYIGISFSENSEIKSLGFFSGFLLCVAITSFCKCKKKTDLMQHGCIKIWLFFLLKNLKLYISSVLLYNTIWFFQNQKRFTQLYYN